MKPAIFPPSCSKSPRPYLFFYLNYVDFRSLIGLFDLLGHFMV